MIKSHNHQQDRNQTQPNISLFESLKIRQSVLLKLHKICLMANSKALKLGNVSVGDRGNFPLGIRRPYSFDFFPEGKSSPAGREGEDMLYILPIN